MTNYKTINIKNIQPKTINKMYIFLLNNNYSFLILKHKNNLFVLTKEKTIFKINNIIEFINEYQKNVFYKTNLINKKTTINLQDLQIFKNYIKKYKKYLYKTKCNKYIFGCIAVKTNNGFITTTRGKQNLNDFTLVESVDHKNKIINVINKKATLNAPLLDHLFKNPKIKAIVHLHKYNNNLPFYEYAFPGTVKDSIRNNTTSFNIRHHGLVYLFDKNNNLI